MNKTFDDYLKLFDEDWQVWFSDTYCPDVLENLWADQLSIQIMIRKITAKYKYELAYTYGKEAMLLFFVGYRVWKQSVKNISNFKKLRELAEKNITSNDDNNNLEFFKIIKELDKQGKSLFAEQFLSELSDLKSGIMDSLWNPDIDEDY
jgi:hypothetical protein|nr:MAG TPA: hypothetical protein [Caudoviricetes sp.]